MTENLAGTMRHLMARLNSLIAKYETTVSQTTKELEAAISAAHETLNRAKQKYASETEATDKQRSTEIERANVLLARSSRVKSSAQEHLRRQSVSVTEPMFFKANGSGTEAAVTEADRRMQQAEASLSQLLKVAKPTNHQGFFLGLGVPGFIISVCAAANASSGYEAITFFVVNGVALGLATAIMILRNGSAADEMKSHYHTIQNMTQDVEATAESFVGEAKSRHAARAKLTKERLEQAKVQNGKTINAAKTHYATTLTEFKSQLIVEIEILRREFMAFHQATGFTARDWNDGGWTDWQPATESANSVCFGTLSARGVKTLQPYFPDSPFNLEIPALVPFAIGKEGRSLVFTGSGDAKEQAAGSVQSLIVRLLATVPPGKVKFTLIDPVGLGQHASGLMQLADFDESLVSGKAWTEPQHIERELLELTEHMETVIQKYLRNDYQSIEQYNANAGEIAEPYRVLVVWDFPANFTETAARRLVSIAENGPRCGVHTIVVRDTSAEKKLPYGFTPGDLERTSDVIDLAGGRFVWRDETLQEHQLILEQPPPAELSKHIVNTTGAVAKNSMKVQVPYPKLLKKAGLTEDKWWQQETINSIETPLGPHGANKVQSLTFGERTAHHAIVIGRTGSGKSNLMHVIITSLALGYSPQELELYLIDFKQGVEFKPYALCGLPHAKVVAIESEREFGISVLRGLDAELTRRGELFRANNLSNITDYRNKVGKLPRILLMVDEFQEFFSQEDAISSQARLVLDRLVRQGRSQGIHVMLGSQTLKGASDLPHNIISQMGIRIALQCSETDARAIMGDDNPVNRQLTRPGEAIYNDESGQVEANKLFQIALFAESDRQNYLEAITKLAAAHKNLSRPIVFEGNEPAKVNECAQLNDRLFSGWQEKIRGVDAWLGEPIAIKPAVAARFRRQGGSHLLAISRDEQQGVGIMLSAFVSLLGQYSPSAARFLILNLTTADSDWYETIERLGGLFPHDIEIVPRKKLNSTLKSLVSLIDECNQDERPAAELSDNREVFLIILGLHRVKELRDEFEGGSSYFGKAADGEVDPKLLFARIMRDGSESGIHTLAWCDSYANLVRIDRRLLGEFAMRVAGPMSNDDSQRVIDDAMASRFERPHRAVFFDEERPGQLEKFRPYAIPDNQWLEQIGAHLKSRGLKAQPAAVS